MEDERIQIILEAVDRTRKVLDEVQAKMGQVSDKSKAVVDQNRKHEESNKRLARSTEGLNGALKKLVGLLGTYVGVRMIGRAVKGTIDLADAHGKLARNLGISVKSLTILNYVAGRAGLEQRQFENSLKILTQRVFAAADGQETYMRTFRLLGLSIRDGSGNVKDMLTLVRELADRFNGLEDGTLKAGLATELFGARNAGILTLFEGGSAQIDAYADRLESLGGVYDEDLSRKAEDFNDLLGDMRILINGITLQVLPELLKKLNSLLTAWTTNEEKLAQLKVVLGGVVELFGFLVSVVGLAVRQIANMSEILENLFAAIILGLQGNFTAAFDAVALAAVESSNKVLEQLEFVRRKFDEFTGRGGVPELTIPGVSPSAPRQTGLGEADPSQKSFLQGMQEFTEKLGTQAQVVAGIIEGTLGNAIAGVSQGITGLINGTSTWGEAMEQTKNAVVGALVEIAVKMVAQQALSSALQLAGVETSTAAAGMTTAAWAPAAAATNAATYGSSAAVGLGITLAMIAAIIAALAAAGGAFEEGGLVPGPSSDHDNRLAAIATGEFVIPSRVVRKFGADHFQSYLTGGASGVTAMPISAWGYETGGLVGPAPGRFGPSDVNIAMVNSREEMRRFQEREGTKIVVDQLRKRSNRISS